MILTRAVDEEQGAIHDGRIVIIIDALDARHLRRFRDGDVQDKRGVRDVVDEETGRIGDTESRSILAEIEMSCVNAPRTRLPLLHVYENVLVVSVLILSPNCKQSRRRKSHVVTVHVIHRADVHATLQNRIKHKKLHPPFLCIERVRQNWMGSFSFANRWRQCENRPDFCPFQNKHTNYLLQSCVLLASCVYPASSSARCSRRGSETTHHPLSAKRHSQCRAARRPPASPFAT